MKYKSKWIIAIISVLICCLAAAFISACNVKDNDNGSSGGDNTQSEQPSDPEKGTYDMSGVVFGNSTVPYDGQSHSIIATNLPTGVTATYDGNGKTNAGTYTITAHFTGDGANYNPIPDKTATLTISKATYDMNGVVFGNSTVPYDGQEHSIIATNLPAGVTVSYENNYKVNAGTYTITAHFTGDSVNYNPIPDKTATLTISKATYDMSGVVFSDLTVEYDGQPHSIYATNLPTGVTVAYEGNEQTTAGTYTVTAHFTGDSVNYNPIPDKTATLTISKATYDMNGVVFDNSTVPYDGQEHSITATNLPQGVTATYDGNGKTNAGTYTVTAHFTGDSVNYNPIPNKTAKLTILPTELSGISFDDDSFVYDGTPKFIYISGNLPDGITVEYEGNGKTTVGEYTVTAKFTATSNYKALPDLTATLTITKATYDMSGVTFDNKTVKYDGQPHSITATNLPEGVTATYEGNGQTTAGTYTVTAKFSGDSVNYYAIENKTATLKIDKATYDMSGVTFDNKTVKYDGQPHSITATNLPEGVTVTYEGNGQIEKGEYTITAKFTGDSVNYNPIEDKTAKLTITRETHKVTFKQEGQADIIKEVADLAALAQSEIPTPVQQDGYTIVWEDTDLSCITEDITVNAVKSPITYIINYELYGGTNAQGNPASYTIEDTYITLLSPQKERAVFGGWYDNANYLGNPVTKVAGGSYGDITLHAKWIEFSVVAALGFEIDYSSETPRIYADVAHTTQNIDLANRITVSANCTWKLYADFIGNEELRLKAMTLNIGHNIAYIIVFHDDGEHMMRYELDIYRLDMKEYTFMNLGSEYDSGTVEEKSTIEAPTAPERTGYDFIGWAVEGSTKLVDFPYTVTEDITFVALYVPIIYKITYHLNKGENDENNPASYDIETATITLKPATRSGAIFQGWFNDEECQTQVTEIKLGSYGDKEFYAKWELITYTITYHLNDGENTEGNPASYDVEDDDITLLPATRTGYAFEGWFEDEQFNTQIEIIEVASVKNYNLYAKWEIITYTITYHLNGGDNSENNPESYDIETADITLQPATREDYTFMGWFTDAEFEESITTIALGSYGDIQLYAKWNYGTEGLEFTQNGEEYSLTGYSGTLMRVVVPEEWNGLPVTSIGGGVFSGFALESLTIPFVGATKNGTSNTHFGYVFGASSYSYNSDYVPTSLKTVNVSGATTIDNSAFYNCTSLMSITIPDSVTSIGDSAFYNCTSLTSVTIPDSVTTIGEYAFRDCTSLETVYWNAINCTSAGSYNSPFDGCTALTTVIFGDNVQTIPAYAFDGCSKLTSVTIGNGVTTIGVDAFDGCSKLTSVTIGNSVTTIGGYAFRNCTSLESITIPDSVTTIGGYAFSNCTSLTSITIPDSVTSIGDYAFRGCTSLETVYWNATNCTSVLFSIFGDCTALTTVIIGHNVQTIPAWAFYGCSGITKIEIPDSVTTIGNYAFEDCTSLETVYWNATNCTSAGSSRSPFGGCTALTTIIIGDNVQTIPAYAFDNCTSLTSITIPDSVTTIGDYAFDNCKSLESVTIPNSVITIGRYAFRNCTSLTIYAEAESKPSGWGSYWNNSDRPVVWNYGGEHGVTESGIKWGLRKGGTAAAAGYSGSDTAIIIPQRINGYDVVAIVDYAFYNCTSLTSITIPNGVTSISNYAFRGCTSLETVYWNATNCTSAGSSGSHIFYGCTALTTVIIGENVQTIPAYAFYNCTSLISVTIGNSVTSIGNWAFYDCTSLTSITIPDSVTSIGSYAFRNCTSLTSVTIPNSVNTISFDTFHNCTNLETVYYGGTAEQWGKISIGVNNVYLQGATRYYFSEEYPFSDEVTEGNFWHYDENGEIEIWSATEVLEYELSGESYIVKGIGTVTSTDIVIPSTYKGLPVTAIGENAFSGCSSLISVTISENIETISNYAFYNCSNLSSVYWNAVNCATSVTLNTTYIFSGCPALKTVIFGDEVQTIPGYIFLNCSSIENLTFGNNVTSIGRYAFHGCSGLKTLTIPNSVTFIDEMAFVACTGLTDITISNSLEEIGMGIFGQCSGIKSIIIPDGVITIGQNAFVACTGLEEIVIPDSVATIDYNAFENCRSLISIIIPENVTTIGDYAFYNCTGLESLYWNSINCNTIGASAWSGCAALTTIIVGEDVETIPAGAFHGCGKLERITIPFVGGSAEISLEDYLYPFGYIFGTSSYTGGAATTQNYYYYFSNSGIGYAGATTYYIPMSLKNVTLTGTDIVEGAFHNCSGLESITLGDGITNIGDGAFWNCTDITSIAIPNSVETIGPAAFNGCTSLETIYWNAINCTSAGLKNGIFSSGNEIFKGCTGLTTVIIDDSVQTIPAYAFAWCDALTSVVVPNSVTTIGNVAFEGCTNLKAAYYDGTAEQWNEIIIGGNNACLKNAIYYFSEEYPFSDEVTEGNFWHYDENGKIVVWQKKED